MVCIFMACVLRIYVDASTLLYVLRLMLWVSVASFPSTTSTKSCIVLVKSCCMTNGAMWTELLIAWTFGQLLL